jgi:putative ABC transport system permease protein
MSFGRTLSITIISIRYRFFRSLVTVGVITVAMAFLMNILTESLIKRSAFTRTSRLIDEYRLPVLLAARFTLPDSGEEILQRFAAGPSDPVRREYLRMAPLSETEISALAGGAATAKTYLDYFAGLEYNRRHRLVRESEGIRIFDVLQDPAELARFDSAFNDTRRLNFPSGLDAFHSFLAEWPGTKALLAKVIAGHSSAIMKLRSYTADRPLMSELSLDRPALRESLRSAGFSYDDRTADVVSRRAGQILKTSILEASILKPGIRQTVSAYLDMSPNDVSADTLWKLLRTRSGTEWYLKTLGTAGVTEAAVISAADVDQLSATKKLEALLRKIEMLVGGETAGGILNLGERMTWLVVVSLLLCMVGISNAMLMSVTERFREIAILKCLGALDGFIMLMFVLESCVLGLFGGIAGSLLGCLIALFRMAVPLGSMAFTAAPFGAIASAALVSILLGILLSAVSSIYPSFRAARLAPLEAMRVE